jgi:hypothetical protein
LLVHPQMSLISLKVPWTSKKNPWGDLMMMMSTTSNQVCIMVMTWSQTQVIRLGYV